MHNAPCINYNLLTHTVSIKNIVIANSVLFPCFVIHQMGGVEISAFQSSLVYGILSI